MGDFESRRWPSMSNTSAAHPWFTGIRQPSDLAPPTDPSPRASSSLGSTDEALHPDAAGIAGAAFLSDGPIETDTPTASSSAFWASRPGLRALRLQAQDHCQHRGAGGHRADPGRDPKDTDARQCLCSAWLDANSVERPFKGDQRSSANVRNGSGTADRGRRLCGRSTWGSAFRR